MTHGCLSPKSLYEKPNPSMSKGAEAALLLNLILKVFPFRAGVRFLLMTPNAAPVLRLKE